MGKLILLTEEKILDKIYFIRGKKIMLDRDLAKMYGVQVKVLNQAVKRNLSRFPEDFMFKLVKAEDESIKSQFVTLKRGQHSKFPPYAFTEQGVAMLSSILKSETAVQVNIHIIRVFTRMRELLSTHQDVLLKLEKLEKKLMKHDVKMDKYEKEIQLIFSAVKELLNPVNPPRRKIGFIKR